MAPSRQARGGSAATPPLAQATPFSSESFTGTRFHDPASKARFASHFTRFVAAGFPESQFPSWFYERLSGNAFGLTRQYNRAGFYAHWFSTPADRLAFVDRVLGHEPVGKPDHTFVDVEVVLQGWLRSQGVRDRLAAALSEETEAAERALLRSLLQRYPDEAGRSHAVAGPAQTELFPAA